MIKVEFGGLNEFTKKLNALERRVEHVERAVPAEFNRWQRHDMNRRRPSTKHSADGAYTIIRPHSRLELGLIPGQHRHHSFRTKGGHLRRAQRPGHQGRWGMQKTAAPAQQPKHTRPLTSTRPILRLELLEQLQARMKELLKRTMRWE